MELSLVRHAQPEWIKDGLCVVDPRLSERGFVQAEHLGHALADETFAEFLVSPLLRARQTAAPLAARFGVTPEEDAWLEECREPDWHGEPAEVARDAYLAESELHHDERWEGLPGGESARDFQTRIHSGLIAFLAARGVSRAGTVLPLWNIAEPGARILWVAHAGTNSVVISHLLGVAPVPWEWDRFRLGHASISRLITKKVGEHFAFCLDQLSGVEHLPKDMRTS